MARRFNPAPGWPAAPEGWLPGPEWQPDPSWPTAPEGWQIVIDDSEETNNGRLAAVAGSLRDRHAVKKAEREARARTAEAELKADGRLFDFESHIDGKNARVRLYPDRLEWERRDRMTTGAKAATATFTAGTSLLFTGVSQNRDTETVYINQISGVKTKKHLINTSVLVITAGNTIDMRVSHDEAERVKRDLNQLIAGTHPALARGGQGQGSIPSSQSGDGNSSPSLQQLAEWHSAGVITDEEFAAAKKKALGI